MYACNHENERGFFAGVCAPSDTTAYFRDPPHPATRNIRSGSRAALAWTALRLGVDVDHHPSRSRAPFAGHPRIALRVVDSTLEASQAGALLAGARVVATTITP